MIEFNVPGNGLTYINLKNTRLYIKVGIKRFDGTPVTAADKVWFVNIPLSSIFRQCDVSLNQKIISPEISCLYPYKAYFDIITGYGEDAKETQMQ